MAVNFAYGVLEVILGVVGVVRSLVKGNKLGNVKIEKKRKKMKKRSTTATPNKTVDESLNDLNWNNDDDEELPPDSILRIQNNRRVTGS